MRIKPPPEVESLFEPGKIGKMEVKNRIIMAPMLVGLSEPDGSVGDRMIRFYAERAEAYVGLIAVGGVCPDPRYRSHPGQPALYDDKFIPGWKNFVEEIKRKGARVTVQLLHPGRLAPSIITKRKPVAPSPIPSKLTGETPKELTVEEIIEIENYFAEAAKRAKKAGFDGVEICASAGYIFNQFLSPATNKRTDEYGGPLENRMRFLLETVERIKSAIGKDYPLIVRISAEDYLPGGTTFDETKKVVKALEDAGVDAINVTTGWHESPRPLITREVPPGGFVYYAEELKKIVDIPIIASNRIKYPQLASKIISEGKADFVSIGRALIADPEWAKKAYEGRFNEIRPCIACGHCLESIFMIKAVECTVNPRAGKELEYEIKKAERKKQVLVIGGGPAGMEAAITAAMRGYNVTLLERSDKLGGVFRLATVPPYKGELMEVIEFYETMLKKYGVNVKFGVNANVDVVEEHNPDVIIVATGATPIIPNIPGIDLENVVHAYDVLAGKVSCGDNVVVIGGGGVGLETADYLSEMGKKVTVIEMLPRVGRDLERTVRWVLLKRLGSKGVQILTKTTAKAIEKDGVLVEQEGQERKILADTVVIAVGAAPNKALYEQLTKKFKEVYAVGDCISPGRARDAISAAFKVALKI
ncbi:MAG: oxidoreductase [Candidatus Baldrarchaeia archaeon]